MVLDVMLPKLRGHDICRQLRGEGARLPIIMLTARGQEIDKVVGLKLGADDYVTKPFSFMELLARVEAVLRRSSSIWETRNRFRSRLLASTITITMSGGSPPRHPSNQSIATISSGL